MKFECIFSARDSGWAVEGIDYQSEGEVSRVLFMGNNAEALAHEYASRKNASTQSQRQPELHTSEA